MKKSVKLCIIILVCLLFISISGYCLARRDYYEKEKLVKEDELKYGNKYFEFQSEVYKEKPERIIIKMSNTTDEFYIFDKNHDEYEHLLKVALDRMFYASNEDFNNWAFTPYTMEDVANSNENFIIFDYDDEYSEQNFMYNDDYNRDIFFRYQNETRLYRLVDYLIYYEKKYNIEELRSKLNKQEFIPANEITSGYKYMHPGLIGD